MTINVIYYKCEYIEGILGSCQHEIEPQVLTRTDTGMTRGIFKGGTVLASLIFFRGESAIIQRDCIFSRGQSKIQKIKFCYLRS